MNKRARTLLGISFLATFLVSLIVLLSNPTVSEIRSNETFTTEGSCSFTEDQFVSWLNTSNAAMAMPINMVCNYSIIFNVNKSVNTFRLSEFGFRSFNNDANKRNSTLYQYNYNTNEWELINETIFDLPSGAPGVCYITNLTLKSQYNSSDNTKRLRFDFSYWDDGQPSGSSGVSAGTMCDGKNVQSTNVGLINATFFNVSMSPVITNISITPTLSYSNSTLNCSTNYIDDNDDKSNLSITWFNGSTQYSTEVMKNILSGSFFSRILNDSAQNIQTTPDSAQCVGSYNPACINGYDGDPATYTRTTTEGSADIYENWSIVSGNTKIGSYSSTYCSAPGTAGFVQQCYNYSSNSWVDTINSAESDIHSKTIDLSNYGCLNGDTFQLKTTNGYCAACMAVTCDGNVYQGTTYYGSNISYYSISNIQNRGEIWNCTVNATDVTSMTAINSTTNTVSGNFNPAVSLLSPANDTTDISTSQIFSCNASDDLSLYNISLYIWNSSGQVLKADSASISGVYNSSNLTYSFSENDTFKWNCLVSDTDNATTWGVNKTITIDTESNVLTKCANITKSGSYIFNSTIDNWGVVDEGVACMNITVSDVVFDCQNHGHYIDGSNLGTNVGINVRESSSSLLTNVTIQNCNITDFYVGSYFRNVQNSTINHTFSFANAGYGYVIYSASYNFFDHINTTDKGYGIAIYYANHNQIKHSVFKDQSNYGIYLFYSSYNNLSDSALESNSIYTYYNIYLYSHTSSSTQNSSYNGFYNNIFNNTAPVYVRGLAYVNYFNLSKNQTTNIINGPYTGGNYWKDYGQNDTTGDYIGDTNYIINSPTMIDYFPLVLTSNYSIVLTVDNPQSQTYPSNFSIPINFSLVNLSSAHCEYKINSTVGWDVYNTTIVNCQNTTFNVSGEGIYSINITINDTLNATSSKTITFGVSLTYPAVVLVYPIGFPNPSDTKYLNYSQNIFFNFTATKSDGLDTCQLWSNWSGIWDRNYTWVKPVNATQNYTKFNLSDGTYLWNVNCNDSVNHIAWALNNFTVAIDTIYPSIIISSPTNESSSEGLAVSILFNISDSNSDSCFFTLRNSTGGVHNYAENTTIACSSTTRDISVLSYGTFTFSIYDRDKVGFENHSSVTFTLTAPVTPPAGGGGGGSSKKICNNETKKWKISSEQSGEAYSLYTYKNTLNTFKVYYINSGTDDRIITTQCIDSSQTPGMCQLVKISNGTLILKKLSTDAVPLEVRVDLRETQYDFGDTLTFFLESTDENGCYIDFDVTIVVSRYAGILHPVQKLTSDFVSPKVLGEKEAKFPYWIFLGVVYVIASLILIGALYFFRSHRAIFKALLYAILVGILVFLLI